jgi:hypothetical protein
MQHCRSCGAKILWATTEKGRRMPVDFSPNEKGNIFLQHRPEREPLAVYATAEQIAAFEGTLQQHRLFTSHFATCPEAKKWRKK